MERRRARVEDAVLGVAGLLMCALIVVPLAVIVAMSFRIEEWGARAVYSLDNYVLPFTEPRLLVAVRNTVVASAGSTVLATVVGATLAWLNARTNMPWKRALDVGNVVPLYLSPFVGAIAWIYLAAPRSGYLNKLVSTRLGLPPDVLNVYGVPGIVWVQGIFFAPLIYLMTIGALRRMDPALEESSRACGRGMRATMLRISLPLIGPSILSGVILTFVSSAGEFGVPLTLGVPLGIETLSTQIFEVLQRSRPNYNVAAALGSILLVTTIVLAAVHRHVVLPRQFITITGRGYRPATIDLGGWRHVAAVLNLVYLLVAVGLPLFILVVMSFHRLWLGSIRPAQLTVANYVDVVWRHQAALGGLRNSLVLAVAGASIAVGLSLVLSLAIYRSRLPGRRWLDIITSLPVGIPGIVLSMGMLLTFIRSPLYGTLLLLLIAYIARFIPVGQRGVGGVLLSMSPELEESSRSCGAGWLRTLSRVTLPLLKPGMAAAWMLLFILFLRELPISILLWTPGNEVMSVVLWQLLEHAPSVKTAAYAMVQSVVILAVIVLFRRVIGPDGIEP